jgi:hypothetical protein
MADEATRPWEYRTLHLEPGEQDNCLGRMGRDGWELVQGVVIRGGWRIGPDGVWRWDHSPQLMMTFKRSAPPA